MQRTNGSAPGWTCCPAPARSSICAATRSIRLVTCPTQSRCWPLRFWPGSARTMVLRNCTACSWQRPTGWRQPSKIVRAMLARPSAQEVAALIRKLSAILHAYALRMETALTAGTYEELIRARTGSSTSRQMTQIERICRAVNRDGSPYGHLFHESNQLLAAGQRFVTASEQLTSRLVEVVSMVEGGVLGLADYDTYRDAAINCTFEQLATVAANVPLQTTPPLVHLADLADAAAELDLAPRARSVPEPPLPDPAADPRTALAERREKAKSRKEARRAWAQGLIADDSEVDITSHATTWPHAARLLADLMALSRDPEVPVAADVGDPAPAKKCHETATEPAWPCVRQPRTCRSQKINMSHAMRPYRMAVASHAPCRSASPSRAPTGAAEQDRGVSW